jgi:hypothetical protein
MEAAITDNAFLVWVVCRGSTEIVHFLVVLRGVLSDKLDGLMRVFLVLGARFDYKLLTRYRLLRSRNL